MTMVSPARGRTGARRASLLLALAVVAAATWLPGAAPLRAQEVKFVRIGTGPIGGTYFPVGGLIANMISGPPGSMACDQGGSCGVPGLIAAAVSTQGSVENVGALAAARLDLALCQANVAHDALAGGGAYAGKPLGMLRAIANLFPEAVHLVVRRADDIKEVGQLKGKRVSLGETDSGTLATARVVLRGYGLSLKEFKPVYEKLARSSDMLAMNEIDAYFMVGGQPIAAVVHAAERMPIALVALSGANARRIVADQPFLKLTVIPAGAYTNVPLTETIGVGAQLLTTSAMSDGLAYAITRALWEPANRKILETGNAHGQRIQPQTALEGLAVPLHRGAERYYKENGMIPSERL